MRHCRRARLWPSGSQRRGSKLYRCPSANVFETLTGAGELISRHRGAWLHTWRLLGLPGLLDPTPPPTKRACAPMLICSERHREPPPRRYNVPAPHAVNKHLVTRRTNGHGARNHKVHAEADRRHITTKICVGCRRISTVCLKKIPQIVHRSFAFLQQLRLYRRTKNRAELARSRRTTTRFTRGRV